MNLIIDGNNLLHRAFWASKNSKYFDDNNSIVLEEVHSEEPFNSYCTYLFLKSVRSYVEKFLPRDIYIAWDKKLTFPSSNFRKDMMKGEYKSTRDHTSSNDIFFHEFVIEKVCASLGIKSMYPNVLEADDVIAWLSKQVSPNIIISVDNDLYQLIDNNTSFYHLNKKEIIDGHNFESIVSVPLRSFLYYKAILGDASDNVVGFPGHGKVRSRKLAVQLTENNGDISKLSLSPDYIDLLHRNLKIMDLDKGYTYEVGEEAAYIQQFNALKTHTPNFNEFACWVRKLNFKSIIENLEEWKAIFTLNPENPTLVEQLSGK
jgi:5'-3' exonuclease